MKLSLVTKLCDKVQWVLFDLRSSVFSGLPDPLRLSRVDDVVTVCVRNRVCTPTMFTDYYAIEKVGKS